MPSWNYILGETDEEQVGSNTCYKKISGAGKGIRSDKRSGLF